MTAGETSLAPSVTRRLIEHYVAEPHPGPPPSSPTALSGRERDVLRLLARGRSIAEIAAELFFGESTVTSCVSNLLGKLGLRDRVQAVVFAYESGFAGRDTAGPTPAAVEDHRPSEGSNRIRGGRSSCSGSR